MTRPVHGGHRDRECVCVYATLSIKVDYNYTYTCVHVSDTRRRAVYEVFIKSTRTCARRLVQYVCVCVCACVCECAPFVLVKVVVYTRDYSAVAALLCLFEPRFRTAVNKFN